MTYSAQDLTRLVQGDHTDAVAALEDATAGESLGDVEGQFDTLARTSLTGWVAAFGAVGAVAVAGAALDRLVAAVRSAVHRLLDQLGPRARRNLQGALDDAFQLGAQQGVEFLRAASGRRRSVPSARAPRALADEAARIADLISDRRSRALALLGRGQVQRWTDLLHAIGAARSAGSAVRAHVAWVVGRAVNAGLDSVADAAHLSRLWVAEASACVRCLAYTGRIADSSGQFPGGLAWDPRQRHIGAAPIDGPPLHPHCRCRTVAWNPRWRPAGVPFPLALQREAHRSIAYGVGRPSESRAGRLRAVRELLRTEDDLLPAVEARAHAALTAGRFQAAA